MLALSPEATKCVFGWASVKLVLVEIDFEVMSFMFECFHYKTMLVVKSSKKNFDPIIGQKSILDASLMWNQTRQNVSKINSGLKIIFQHETKRAQNR